MHIATLSDHGEIVIPAAVCTAQHWQPGVELVILETAEGILLKPKKPFAKTRLQDVAGCLRYTGKAKTLEEMEAAIARGVRERSE
jgi:bifunctional DNA-binding transcriptional regulator/antitoxin component of YhaV-PrlF toxin-antitoxin module